MNTILKVCYVLLPLIQYYVKVPISTYYFTDKCFEAGTYVGNDIDYVKDLPDAESCQKECQKIPECKFWTYNPNTWNGKNKCFRQTANANETLGTCKKGTCIRGPRDCPGKYISY